MPTLTEKKETARQKSMEALAIVDDEKRTPAERRAAVEKMDPDIKALLDEIKDEEFLIEQRKSLGDITGAGTTEEEPPAKAGEPVEPKAKSIGTQFIESEKFKAVAGKGGQFSTGAIELKATMTESASTGILPQLQPGLLPILFRRLTVAELFGSMPVNSTSLRVIKETTATNAAATVAEGGAKPASTLIFAPVDEPIRKIATSIKITDEMLADYGFVRAYVDGRLTLFVLLAEEDQLLSGDGAGSNIVGILNRSGLQAAQAKGADSRAVAVYKEITKIRVGSFLEPDAIVFHPTDWQAARLEQDANGQFYAGGPFTGAYGQGNTPGMGGNGNFDATPYWNLRVVVTPAATLGTAVVGAFSVGGSVLRKDGGISVEATNSNEDDFLKNLVAIRAEERVGLAVFRPGAFGTVTGL